MIVYNGELYNGSELRSLLKERGWTFATSCDTEVILLGFMEFGPEFVKRLNGIFAFAVFDSREETLHLFRDPMGVKPLFYTEREGELIFASELKAILAHPAVELTKPNKNEEETCTFSSFCCCNVDSDRCMGAIPADDRRSQSELYKDDDRGTETF